jgi:cytochrome c oxidase cbb3-type subunit 3
VKSFRSLCLCASLGLTLLSGCGTPPGEPQKGSETLAPNNVVAFDTLYSDNCAGCHGANGRGGVAISLADPVYLAIADETTMQKVIVNGVPGTSMPAFAQRAGGTLTDKQIDVIIREIRSRWSRPGTLDGAHPPSYAPTSTGDVARGDAAFRTYCESCHGQDGRGGAKGSAITNDSFLALVSDQGLRSLVIAGRPELGAPSWRDNVPGKPMTDQDVTDVVAWLASRRTRTPGQPYAVSHLQND